MRTREAAGEIRRLLLARPIQTVLVAGLAGAVVVAVLLTVGRAVVLEQTIEARTETPEGRTIVITDLSPGGLIRPEMLRAVSRLDHVERAVAVSTPVDAVNAHIGIGSNRVPLWGVTGDVRSVATLTSGRLPREGEVLISEAARHEVGFGGPFGALLLPDGQDASVVGTFEARPPFDQMAAGAIRPTRSDQLRKMYIVVDSVQLIEPMTMAVVGMFDRAASADLRVERSAALADLQRVLTDDVNRFGRELIVAVLLAAMVLVGLVVLAEVLSRRKDLGRQRALGARQSTVVYLLAVRTGTAAAMGACVGLMAGLAVLAASTGELPRPSFSAGLAILAVLGPALAAAVPALWAAQRDPVLELRTP